MELWIRSQDRDNLIKVYDIWIDDTNMTEQGCVSIMANSNFSFELGVYKTKERALEVLDEIQKLLNPIVKHTPIVKEDIKPEYIYKHYVNCGSNIEVIQLNTFVYEIPKE